jgi:hypothetical protein
MMNPTSSAIDITNQKAGVMGLVSDAICLLNAITVGTIPAINRFIESESATAVVGCAAGPRVIVPSLRRGASRP